MQAMIFCAGLGTRLKPITDTLPKALLPLAGKTLLEYQIDALKMVGITDIVINLHHHARKIVDFIRQNKSFGISIRFSDETDMLLNTGGGLRKALPLFDSSDEPLLALNVDILSTINISDFILSWRNDYDAMLVVSERLTQRYLSFDNGRLCGWKNVETGETRGNGNGKLLAFSGMQLLSKTFLNKLQNFESEKGSVFSLIDFYLAYCDKANIRAYEPTDYRMMDVGKIDYLKQAEQFAKNLSFTQVQTAAPASSTSSSVSSKSQSVAALASSPSSSVSSKSQSVAALASSTSSSVSLKSVTVDAPASSPSSSVSSKSDSVVVPASSPSSSVSSKKNPIIHNKLRRKQGHDYTAPSIYLITVVTRARKPLLGTLDGNTPDNAFVRPTTLGESVISSFRDIENIVKIKTGCSVQVLQYQLMPDHFHGILYVIDPLPSSYHLGKIVGAWKGACSRAYWKIVEGIWVDNQIVKVSLFEDGYNDRVLVRKNQLQNWIRYLKDNPRRLWLKQHYSDRFTKVYDFQAGKSGHRYTAVGNTFLVTYPEIVQVRCHRNLTEAEIRCEVEHYLALARCGAVMVSPFISPAEKAVYDACYNERLKIIRIVKRGLDGRFVYPSGRDFEGCAEGFLLILAPYMEGSEQTRDVKITREQCLDMNAYAADIAILAQG